MPIPKYNSAGFSTAVQHSWTEGQYYIPDVIAFAAAIALDMSTANSKVKTTLTGNTTVTVSNGVEGQECVFYFTQDGTGGRTVTWSGVSGVPGSVTTTANSVSPVYIERLAAGWAFVG